MKRKKNTQGVIAGEKRGEKREINQLYQYLPTHFLLCMFLLGVIGVADKGREMSDEK